MKLSASLPLHTRPDGPLRVIVCGGRNFGTSPDNLKTMLKALDEIHANTPIGHIWHGNALGADHLAGVWAAFAKVRCTPVPARWKEDGKAAGPKRNQRMLGQSIDLVIAFPGGRGTADMKRRALKAGIAVLEPFA